MHGWLRSRAPGRAGSTRDNVDRQTAVGSVTPLLTAWERRAGRGLGETGRDDRLLAARPRACPPRSSAARTGRRGRPLGVSARGRRRRAPAWSVPHLGGRARGLVRRRRRQPRHHPLGPAGRRRRLAAGARRPPRGHTPARASPRRRSGSRCSASRSRSVGRWAASLRRGTSRGRPRGRRARRRLRRRPRSLVALLCRAPAEPGLRSAAARRRAPRAASAGALGLVVGAGHAGHVRGLVPVPGARCSYGALAASCSWWPPGRCSPPSRWRARRRRRRGGRAARPRPARRRSSRCCSPRSRPERRAAGGVYLVGPGFALGTGTVVSPAEVDLGPVPALPVLAAIPADGPAPGWVSPARRAAAARRSSARPWPHGPSRRRRGAPVRCAASAAARRRGAPDARRPRGPAARSGRAGWPSSVRRWAPCCCGPRRARPRRARRRPGRDLVGPRREVEASGAHGRASRHRCRPGAAARRRRSSSSARRRHSVGRRPASRSPPAVADGRPADPAVGPCRDAGERRRRTHGSAHRRSTGTDDAPAPERPARVPARR